MERYRSPADLPREVPVFPLGGVILLPRVTLPLNVFEPRYLTMVDDALGGERILGLVQPASDARKGVSPEGKSAPLQRIGGAGRITAFQETDDGRMLITLTGIARFEIASEITQDKLYRTCRVGYDRFARDLVRDWGQEAVDRERLLHMLGVYLEARELEADWDAINASSTEFLVNTLSMISPYGPAEKQALLEAEDLGRRAEILMALAEMDLASRDDGSDTTMQ